jgi:hypothetical protein
MNARGIGLLIWATVVAVTATVAPVFGATILIPTNAVWRYYDEAPATPAGWRATGFDDNAWKLGAAQLGYGEGDEVTPIAIGIARPVTTYFRHTLVVTQSTFFSNLRLRLLRDDGAIVYVNGTEIFRSNMPEGGVGHSTSAATLTAGSDEEKFFQRSVWPYAIGPGTNTVAVEVHQATGGIDDCSFALELVANLPITAPVATIVSPAGGTVFDDGHVPIQVAASDYDGHITHVEFFAGTNFIGSDLSEPFEMTWLNAPPGRHSLTAVAVDNSTLRGHSAPVQIQVGADQMPRLLRGPYLQSGGSNTITLCWRTDWYVSSRVLYGTNPAALNLVAFDPEEWVNHALRINGLEPDTTYYYEVHAGTNGLLAAGPQFFFRTAPVTNRPVRIWAIGDSGTANTNAAHVRDGYTLATADRPADLWLMLGDNAYESGTDDEYQAAVFRMYTNQLPNTVLWPTLGNHDAASPGWEGEFPYLDIFTLPTSGECGGVSSGTEKYYSFDYANIHFVCLDSQSSSRLPGSPMLKWLEDDLAATSKDWIIAFWHHPPYSWGTHTSDAEFQLIEMREDVVPILERYGVDLTLCGHSHNYERSMFLNGHYGRSWELEPGMILDDAFGHEEVDRAYAKPAGGIGAGQGSVFVVCGCSGEGGPFQITRHPAMRVAMTSFGSMLIDVDGDRLDATFIGQAGEVRDQFTILKGENATGVRPPLEISRQGSKARLSWPTARPPFKLQEARAPGQEWNDVPESPSLLGRRHFLQREMQGTNRVFRLRAD